MPVTLTNSEYEARHDTPRYVVSVGTLYSVALLEISTRDANSFAASTIRNGNPRMQTLLLPALEFKYLVPCKHDFQILRQCYVLQYKVAIYISAAEEVMLFIYDIVPEIHAELQTLNALNTMVCSFLQRAHVTETSTTFCTDWQRHLFLSNRPLCNSLNDKEKRETLSFS